MFIEVKIIITICIVMLICKKWRTLKTAISLDIRKLVPPNVIFRKILCSCVNIFLPFLLTTIICYLPSCTFVVYIFKCMNCLGCCCFFVFFFCFCLFVCLFWVFFGFFLIYKTYNLFIMNALNNTVDKCYLLFFGGMFC